MNANHAQNASRIYTINELSEIYDITPRTLRHYEDMGLLSPERRGNQRLYRERDRVRLQLILRGRRLGFGLSEIQEMLNLYDADPTEVTQLQDVIRRGDVKLRELQSQVEELQTIMAEMTELRMTMQRRLEQILLRGE
ncbi:MAG: MerR family transcriptional regulator [Sulfobacillus benefaciens]|uniref:MerR family transcriptional regulator n=1 Tax=Sulfobacillus benefaciens TaxID=453960 RepID=A0A2T2XJV9_9FIRM|nr:MAG: MerR family transcriptional regulator [Sulfobacillus benefaciens]